MMAAGDVFDITIRGFGGHGARPHLAVDPILLAAQVIQAINHVVSRRVDPLASGVISICMLNAGTAHNIIPDTVTLAGTCRSMSPAVRQLLQDELRKACAIVEPLGGSFELDFKHGYPATINDTVATETAFAGIGEVLGADKIFEIEPIMASEDFSFMLQKAPGCYLRLGVKNPNWDREYPVHTSTFRMDEAALPLGVASLVATTVAWMVKSEAK
jgi:amidohydrolase